MKTIRSLNLLLLLALTACEGCKKDEPKPKTELEKLPPITQVGKNTFGCLVNGKAFLPTSSIDAGVYYQLGTVLIWGRIISPFQTLSIVIDEKSYGEVKTQSYELTKFPDSFARANITKDPSYCEYEPQNCLNGTVNISKIDRITYVISGTFEFSIFTASCDTLKVTNGRFDIKYIP